MKTLTLAVDKFYNATFSSALVKRNILSEEVIQSQAVLFNRTGFFILDRTMDYSRLRYFYYKTYLCATRFYKHNTKQERCIENLVINDYGNIKGEDIKRLYEIQQELESYLPWNCEAKSVYTMPHGYSRFYTRKDSWSTMPTLWTKAPLG
jgi:hypothetical protein